MLRAIAIIALVILVLLLVIPLGMGMAMTGGCPECHPPGASAGVGMCLALLASLMIVAVGFRELVRTGSRSSRPLLVARSVKRPPQRLAFA
jgi:hypothetical protein